jgi:hypothetical protein
MMTNAKKIAPKPCKGIELIFFMQNCIKVMHMDMDENTLRLPYMDITLVVSFVSFKY